MSEAMFRFMSKNGAGDGCGGGGGGGGGGVALEVTVLSAESLRLPPPSYYSLIPRRLRPYVTVSSAGVGVQHGRGGGGERRALVERHARRPRGRGVPREPRRPAACTWRCTRSRRAGSSAAPRRWGGAGSPPPTCSTASARRAALRRLSYSLRCPRTGGPARGVVHLAVRVLGDLVPPPPPQHAPSTPPAQPGWCRVAMGIPVSGTSAAVVGMPAWAAWGGEAAASR
ncbi:hypothetical protein OsJ_19977 [Oryza sativa Japonica Group]|uniref:Uncharacterized protein n=1 Tax=Oryza sativa subsp. japonica TaxID=39947 RepID=A3B800_ORYSJ|nr:hypothetical protein OsJ_19977 [Oryza sativa Japonica Group]